MKDALTNVLDRESFLRTLKRRCRRAAELGQSVALICVDLRDFRRMNRRFGLTGGDQVLRYLAARLTETVRESDVVGRIGDDEFALLLHPVMNSGHASLAVHRLQRELQVPMELDGERVKLDIQAGLACYPEHANDPQQLLLVAELALATARLRYQSFMVAPSPDDSLVDADWDLDIALSTALERQEFTLHYQPVVAAADGAPLYFEALMRWHSPVRGNISPGVFIPVAESNGQIEAMTHWVLNTSLRQLSEWREQGWDFGVSINLPAGMIKDERLPEDIERSLSIWEVPAERLIVEITEHSLVVEPQRAMAVLSELHDMGVQVSIDDFGTGYSSLQYFSNLPANALKVDRTFVNRLGSERANDEIVALIIDLAHRFNMQVVAEGVEEPDKLDQLRTMGVDQIQGFLFARPMPADAVVPWLESRRSERTLRQAVPAND